MGVVLKARRRRAPRRARGYSLVEVLLGFVILLIALIGLLPLFTRSIMQNTEGKQSTDATGFGRTELENLMQVDFNNWLVTVTAGSERNQQLFWNNGSTDILGDEFWTDTDPVPAGELSTWLLDTTVRQFGIQGVRDDNLDGIMEVVEGLEDADLDGDPDSPLPAGTAPAFVHLKTLDVTLQNRATAVTLGGATQLELKTFKAF